MFICDCLLCHCCALLLSLLLLLLLLLIGHFLSRLLKELLERFNDLLILLLGVSLFRLLGGFGIGVRVRRLLRRSSGRVFGLADVMRRDIAETEIFVWGVWGK